MVRLQYYMQAAGLAPLAVLLSGELLSFGATCQGMPSVSCNLAAAALLLIIKV